jgi:integrase
MAAAFVQTKEPGVYKRGGRYVVMYRDGAGRQRKESAANFDAARALKAKRATQVAEGEYQALSRVTFRDYAAEWVERYQGSGRGFREHTRTDYRRHLELHAFPYFGDRKKLTEITPRDVSGFIAFLCDEGKQGRRLTDKTVRNIVGGLRVCLATAVREDLIRHNPARDVALPHRPRVEDEDENEQVKVFTRDQLAAFLATVHPRHRVMFRLLAGTGLRWSELAAIRWRDLKLDGSEPHVKVRRAFVRGEFHPPKSRHSRRSVPLDPAVVSDLRRHRRESEWAADDDLVFCVPAKTGPGAAPMHHSNMLGRVLRPIAEEVGAPWAGFHTFRHTCASLLFERGANAKQVQRWLGHHSASFTLDTYIHLLGDDLGEPLDLSVELQGGNKVGTQATETGQNADSLLAAELAA